jgi:type II secretory pathway pseudopilin PulG
MKLRGMRPARRDSHFAARRPCGCGAPGRENAGFTVVEIVIALTIVIIIAAASMPTFRGLRDEQLAREPIQELVRLAKEARLRAMREKRPYQVAFHAGGFTASRYFNPYLQIADLTAFLAEEETGVQRINPNAEETSDDPDAKSATVAKTDLPIAPPGPKLDDHWQEHYTLPEDTQYSIKFWHDLEPMPVVGEVVKLWVFQPTGICQPISVHLQRQSAFFDVEFGALTADIVKEVVGVQ